MGIGRDFFVRLDLTLCSLWLGLYPKAQQSYGPNHAPCRARWFQTLLWLTNVG